MLSRCTCRLAWRRGAHTINVQSNYILLFPSEGGHLLPYCLIISFPFSWTPLCIFSCSKPKKNSDAKGKSKSQIKLEFKFGHCKNNILWILTFLFLFPHISNLDFDLQYFPEYWSVFWSESLLVQRSVERETERAKPMSYSGAFSIIVFYQGCARSMCWLPLCLTFVLTSD